MNYGDDRTDQRIRGKCARSFWTGTMLMLGLLAAPDRLCAADAPVGDQAPMQAPDLGVSPVATIAPARTRFLSLALRSMADVNMVENAPDASNRGGRVNVIRYGVPSDKGVH